MSSTWLYRIAAVVLLLFAALHTYGFMNFRPPTPEGRAVLESMNQVRFEVKGATFSYGGFYEAFGLFATVFMLFSAFVAWHLSRFASKELAWALFASQAAGLVLGCIYFSTPQIVFAGLLTACTGWAALRIKPVN